MCEGQRKKSTLSRPQSYSLCSDWLGGCPQHCTLWWQSYGLHVPNEVARQPATLLGVEAQIGKRGRDRRDRLEVFSVGGCQPCPGAARTRTSSSLWLAKARARSRLWATPRMVCMGRGSRSSERVEGHQGHCLASQSSKGSVSKDKALQPVPRLQLRAPEGLGLI